MTCDEERIEFVAFGVEVDIVVRHRCSAGHCGFPELCEAVGAMLPPGAEPRPEPGPTKATVFVECHGDEVAVIDTGGARASFDDVALGLHAVDQAIRSVVAVEAPGLVFIHAGVVAVGHRAIVLPGPSMSGKTTLIAELVRAGAMYLSDEYAVLDETGLVHPFARRLSVREATGRREVPVDELGGSAATTALPVSLVVEIEFREAGEWRVEPGDQAACARALIGNAVAAQARSAEVLAVAAKTARSARFVHGVRGDASTSASSLLELADA